MVMRAEQVSPAHTHKALGYISLTFRIFPSESADCQYASKCEELGTASCGATIDEAVRNIEEATIQYLNAIEQNGEIERIFRKRHIPIYLGKPGEESTVITRPNELVASFVHKVKYQTSNASLAAV